MKVTAIEEAQDVSIVKVDDLIGSLLTFEMPINDKFEEKKSKFVVFKVDTEDCDDQVERDVDENLTKSIVMLAKGFSKFMGRLSRRSRNNVYTNIKDNQQQNSKGVNF